MISRPTSHIVPCLGQLCVAAYLACLFVTHSHSAHAADHAGPAPAADYGKLPLSFDANQGQADPQVRFTSRGNGYSLYLTPGEAILALRKPESVKADNARPLSQHHAQSSVVRMQVKGAIPDAQIGGEEKLPGTVNYFIGNDPKRWHAGLPTYRKVRYAGIYPGIDLVYYGNQHQLEYDFVVAPGASANSIKLHFDGAQRLKLKESGDLAVIADGGEIAFQKPVLYQEKDGRRQPVEGHFVLGAGNSIGFSVGQYDRTEPLVIDPTLVYSTYLGGTTQDSANAIALDSAGNAYVTGVTYSSDFPVTSGSYQHNNDKSSLSYTAFVAKLNATGTALVYATYLGGSTAEFGNAIAVDASDNAYVVGKTESTDFPVTSGAFQPSNNNGGSDYTGFVSKLNPAGSALIYSTYLGGSSAEDANAIAVDNSGNAFVVGATGSSDFPVTPGAYITSISNFAGAAFVTKLNSAGSELVYSTFLGGNSVGASAQAVKIDSGGNAYVGGSVSCAGLQTSCPGFPVTSGAIQTTFTGNDAAFVTKLNPSGSGILYSTFLGGSTIGESDGAADAVLAMALDAAGDAFVAGETSSTTFPITSGAFQKTNPNPNDDEQSSGFMAKINPAGTSLLYSTYLGGNFPTVIYGLQIDSSGDAYAVGNTTATNFPVTSDALQSTNPTPSTAGSGFVTELNPQGTTLVHSTYLAGSNGASINGVSIDSSGNLYLTGFTYSTNFPVTAGAYQTKNKDVYFGSTGASVFITKLDLGPSTTKIATSTTLAANPNPQAVNKLVTFTVGVVAESGSGTPTGEVTSTVDGAPGPTVTLSGGEATFASDELAVGSHTIVVTYPGDTNYAGSTSNAVIETITQAAPATPTLSPASLTFPATAVGSTSAAQTVTFSNPGTTALSVNSFTFTGTNAAEFLIAGKTCSTSLAAGASCTLTLAFKPTAAGAATAIFKATDNATNSPQTIALSGSTPTGSTASFSPTLVTFPATAVGSTSAAQTVTFTNTGTAPMAVSSFTFTGTNAAEFLIAGKSCGTSLAAGASCTLSLTFKPTASGAATATFKATDNASNSPQTVALSGSTPTGSTASFSPTSVTFPATAVGSTSAAQTVTFTNTGTAPMSVSSFTFTGTNATEFLIAGKTCGTSLAAGASCTLSLAFKPTATGTATATFKATDNATNSPQTVALSGSTPTSTTASLSPAALTFPSTAVGATSAAQTVTFTNTGTTSMSVSSFTFTGTNAAEFLIAGKSCTTSLAAGASCTVSLTFKPTATGAAAATFKATDNATNAPQTVSLAGTGH